MIISPLIITLKNDINGSAVYWGLKENNISPIWIESISDIEFGPISLYSNSTMKWSSTSSMGRDKIGSVWFRRPQWPTSFFGSSTSDMQFLRDEWSKLQKNIFELADDITDTLWINKPSSAYRTENKLVQLQAARECCIDIPDTLVSNNPEHVKLFIDKYDKVIYKPFLLPAWEKKESGKMYTFWVSTIDKDMHIKNESLAICPGIYQRYIDKLFDLRVTVIGNHYFTVKILSDQGEALVDWRSNSITEDIEVDIFNLTKEIKQKLILLVNKLDLVFGCIDLVVDKDGRFYFLEINQGGQFLFIEELVESIPLLQAMCSMIAEGSPNYKIDKLKNISYNKYRNSEYYMDWISNVRNDIETESLSSRAMPE